MMAVAHAEEAHGGPRERRGSRGLRFLYDTGAARSVGRSARQALAEKGFLYVARLAALGAAFPLWRLYDKVFPRSFTFQSARYPYFLHPYNLTWSNERAVEIPIAWAAVRGCRGR